MKKSLLGLIVLLPSCDCTDYARADKETYTVLEQDLLIGIENNPANDEETKELKRIAIESWVFRFESELNRGN